MQQSQNQFLSNLFSNERDNAIVTPVDRPGRKKGVESAGMVIKKQAKLLVEELTSCRPHYVRCIKPNEQKRDKLWDKEKGLHQITYLGLVENINVRRAGFAYRRPFDKFLKRFNLLQYKHDMENAAPHEPYENNPNRGKQVIRKIFAEHQLQVSIIENFKSRNTEFNFFRKMTSSNSEEPKSS